MFEAQSVELLTLFTAAIERQEASAVQRVAHKLKGSVDNFGAPKARDLLLRMEEYVRQGTLAHTCTTPRTLTQELAPLRKELQEMYVGMYAVIKAREKPVTIRALLRECASPLAVRKCQDARSGQFGKDT